MSQSPSKEGPHGPSKRIEITAGQDTTSFNAVITEFFRNHGIAFVLGFSGGADDKTPILDIFRASLETDENIPQEVRDKLAKRSTDAARTYVTSIVTDILEPLRGYRIAVLSGGTSWGVPDAVTRVAKELGFPTIGVYPLAAQNKSALPNDLLDLSICVHPFVGESQWGDESPTFVKLLDAVVVIGGGAGTMTEVSHLLKINEKKDMPRKKWIIPVSGTGGTADKLPFFPGKPAVIEQCIPSHPITCGREVVTFLHKEGVLTDDAYEPTA